MKIIAVAVLAVLALGAAAAQAECTHAKCGEGFVWSPSVGTCVPKTVSS